MRPYGTVSPLFWTGKTGKKLRADRDAQVIALYLMTGPHSHQSGLFYLPLMYLAHEVGIPLEGARKALIALSDDGFCRYDEGMEWVWVCEMAAWQIGSGLKESDKRCFGIANYLDSVPDCAFKAAFIERYQHDFHLESLVSPSQAPPKGATSSGTEQEQSKGASEGTDVPLLTLTGGSPRTPIAKTPKARRSSRVPPEFRPDLQYARQLLPDIDAEREAQKFRDWEFKTPKSDWPATWRTWIGNCADRGQYARTSKSKGGADNGLEYLNP